MNRFIKKTLMMAIPLLLLVVLVNYFGDAAKLFNSDYEKEMVNILNKGLSITNFSNYDERIFQRELVTSMANSPEVIVIGSSRTMLINQSYFPDKKFINNSVSGAIIQDLIGIFQIYKEKGFYPKRIIIGIDPTIFNSNASGSRWKSIKEFYERYKNINKSSSQTTFLNEKYSELFSLSYFQASLKELPKVIIGQSKPFPTMLNFNSTNTKLADGSLVYGEIYRNASPNEIDKKIKDFASNSISNNFDSLSIENWQEFDGFIQALQSTGIVVDIFLCPYAPKVYQQMKDRNPIEECELKLKKYAINNGIKVFGSYNPDALNFDQSYFYDGNHVKEKAISIIFSTKIKKSDL